MVLWSNPAPCTMMLEAASDYGLRFNDASMLLSRVRVKYWVAGGGGLESHS